VLINESTDVDNRDKREMGRAAAARGGFSFAGALGGNFGDKTGDAEVNVQTNGSANFDGSTSYTVERGFTDQISVTIVECLPSGNFLIRGRRERLVGDERRALVVSGVVRPIDIRPDNSIESRFIADFQICYEGDGIESRFTEQGWLTRTWNKVRPL
jgi:flagellar L-ring protein precursor FlgH